MKSKSSRNKKAKPTQTQAQQPPQPNPSPHATSSNAQKSQMPQFPHHHSHTNLTEISERMLQEIELNRKRYATMIQMRYPHPRNINPFLKTHHNHAKQNVKYNLNKYKEEINEDINMLDEYDNEEIEEAEEEEGENGERIDYDDENTEYYDGNNDSNEDEDYEHPEHYYQHQYSFHDNNFNYPIAKLLNSTKDIRNQITASNSNQDLLGNPSTAAAAFFQNLQSDYFRNHLEDFENYYSDECDDDDDYQGEESSSNFSFNSKSKSLHGEDQMFQSLKGENTSSKRGDSNNNHFRQLNGSTNKQIPKNGNASRNNSSSINEDSYDNLNTCLSVTFSIASKVFKSMCLLSILFLFYIVICTTGSRSNESAFSTWMRQQALQSTPALKKNNSHYDFTTIQVFTARAHLDLPFRLVYYTSNRFNRYLNSPISNEYCAEFQYRSTQQQHSPSASSFTHRKNFEKQSSGTTNQQTEHQKDVDQNDEANPCNVKNSDFFSDKFHSILYIHGEHWASNPSEINDFHSALLNVSISNHETNLKRRAYFRQPWSGSSPSSTTTTSSTHRGGTGSRASDATSSSSSSQSRNHLRMDQFRVYSMDFSGYGSSTSSVGIGMIERQTSAVINTLDYLSIVAQKQFSSNSSSGKQQQQHHSQVNGQRKISLICDSLGGLVCLHALSKLSRETSSWIDSIILLNSPLNSIPVFQSMKLIDFQSHLDKLLLASRDTGALSHIAFLSFDSQSTNQDFDQPSRMRVTFPKSIYSKTVNLRDVFTPLNHRDILIYAPFTRLLAKYFHANSSLHSSNSRKQQSKTFDRFSADSLNSFFFAYENHNNILGGEGDEEQQQQLQHNTNPSINNRFSETELIEKCGRGIVSNNPAETMKTFELLESAMQLTGHTLCLRIQISGIIEKGNDDINIQDNHQSKTTSLVQQDRTFFLRTNILSQDIRVLTTAYQKRQKSSDDIEQVEQQQQQEEEQERVNKEKKGQLHEIPADFSFFFGSTYSHELTSKEISNWPVLYFIFSIRNDTQLHAEYAHFYNATYSFENFFLTISSSASTSSNQLSDDLHNIYSTNPNIFHRNTMNPQAARNTKGITQHHPPLNVIRTYPLKASQSANSDQISERSEFYNYSSTKWYLDRYCFSREITSSSKSSILQPISNSSFFSFFARFFSHYSTQTLSQQQFQQPTPKQQSVHPAKQLKSPSVNQDYMIHILEDVSQKPKRNRPIQVSLAYSDDDCLNSRVFRPSNKQLTLIHSMGSLPFQFSALPNNEQQNHENSNDCKASNNNNNNSKCNPPPPSSSSLLQSTIKTLVTIETNFGDYAQILGKNGMPILLLMHCMICCVIIAIQLKYYSPHHGLDVPSQLSLVWENLTKIISFEAFAFFISVYVSKYFFQPPSTPITTHNQKNSNKITIQPDLMFLSSLSNTGELEDIGNSILVSLFVSVSAVTTYVLAQVIFAVTSFACCLCCSLTRAMLLRIPRMRRGLLAIASNFNAFTLLMPLLLLMNSPTKWVCLVIAFWLFLGIAQTNYTVYGNCANLLHGFAYLVLLTFAINANHVTFSFRKFFITPTNSTYNNHNYQSNSSPQFGDSQQSQQQYQQQQQYAPPNYEFSTTTVNFADEFTNEFLTIVCWLIVLAKIDGITPSMVTITQVLLLLESVLTIVFVIYPVAYANSYLSFLPYSIIALMVYYQQQQKHSQTSSSQPPHSNKSTNNNSMTLKQQHTSLSANNTSHESIQNNPQLIQPTPQNGINSQPNLTSINNISGNTKAATTASTITSKNSKLLQKNSSTNQKSGSSNTNNTAHLKPTTTTTTSRRH